MTDEDSEPVDALLADYHKTLLSMHECRVERGGDPKPWNRLVNHLQAVQLRLAPGGLLLLGARVALEQVSRVVLLATAHLPPPPCHRG